MGYCGLSTSRVDEATHFLADPLLLSRSYFGRRMNPDYRLS